MKFRSDFVTNSSSSSYCVSYLVKPQGDKDIIELDLWPAWENEERNTQGMVGIYTKRKINEIVSAIQECKDVNELAELLVDVLNLENEFGIYEDVKNIGHQSEIIKEATAMEKCRECDENFEYEMKDKVIEAVNKINTFLNEFRNYKKLANIDSITIVEYYNACGEFAPECAGEYLQNMCVEKRLDWGDEEAVINALKSDFSESMIEKLLSYESICVFDATIETVIKLIDNRVEKKYNISIADTFF